MTAENAPSLAQTAAAKQANTAVARGLGLSARVVMLILAFVILAEALIYVSALSAARLAFLKDRIAAAHTAALVFTASPQDMIPEALAMEILDSVGSKTIAIKIHGTKRLLAVAQMPEKIDESVDLMDDSVVTAIPAAFRTLFARQNRILNVKGPAPMGGDFIEIVLDEAPLQRALRATSVSILVASVLLSALIASLAALALHLMVLKPIRRLTTNVMEFARNPEDLARVIRPSGASHEIGQAEGALASMQTALIHELHQKKHLAALGLAVAKINHDLRNMLATAQLFSDRLAQAKDATARTIGAKLIVTLDRAIGFCQSTLAYGRSKEPQPQRQWVDVALLAQDTAEALGLGHGQNRISWQTDIPPGLKVYADPEHLHRILLNLARNSVQAMAETPDLASPVISLQAAMHSGAVVLQLQDNGPGIPAHLRGHLFQAFTITARTGGSGLGLAIAAELAQAHGGKIELIEGDIGAVFRVTLPLMGAFS